VENLNAWVMFAVVMFVGIAVHATYHGK